MDTYHLDSIDVSKDIMIRGNISKPKRSPSKTKYLVNIALEVKLECATSVCLPPK